MPVKPLGNIGLDVEKLVLGDGGMPPLAVDFIFPPEENRTVILFQSSRVACL